MWRLMDCHVDFGFDCSVCVDVEDEAIDALETLNADLARSIDERGVVAVDAVGDIVLVVNWMLTSGRQCLGEADSGPRILC